MNKIPYPLTAGPTTAVLLIPTGVIPASKCPRCKTGKLMVITKKTFTPFTAHPQFIGCTDYPICGYYQARIPAEVAEAMEKAKAEREQTEPDF